MRTKQWQLFGIKQMIWLDHTLQLWVDHIVWVNRRIWFLELQRSNQSVLDNSSVLSAEHWRSDGTWLRETLWEWCMQAWQMCLQRKDLWVVMGLVTSDTSLILRAWFGWREARVDKEVFICGQWDNLSEQLCCSLQSSWSSCWCAFTTYCWPQITVSQ